MTREERNNAMKVLRNFDLNNPNVNSLLFSAEEITNAFDMAIKVLEQGDVLDKIRAETEQLHHHPILDFINTDKVVDMALEIIDKYRESEGE